MAVSTFKEQSFTMQEFSNPQIRFLEKSAEVLTRLYQDPKTHAAPNHLAVSFPEFVKAPVQTIEDIHNFFNLGVVSTDDKRNLEAFLKQLNDVDDKTFRELILKAKILNTLN